jgi:hypothetical protein
MKTPNEKELNKNKKINKRELVPVGVTNRD